MRGLFGTQAKAIREVAVAYADPESTNRLRMRMVEPIGQIAECLVSEDEESSEVVEQQGAEAE